MTTVWAGDDVDQLRPDCFYFYFQNASTFVSLVRHVSPSAGRKSANAVDGKAHSCLVTFNDWNIGN
jgi:hypothetical protein